MRGAALRGCALGAIGLLVAAGPASAQPVVHAALDTTATTVGGTLRLTLTAEPAEGWMLDPPGRGLDLPGFRVRGVERIPRPDGDAWVLRIVALEAGEQALGPLHLTARGPGGESTDVATQAVPVQVATNLPPEEPPADGGETAPPPEPADLKPALEAPRNWTPLLVAAAAALLAGALAFWLIRKWRRRERGAAKAPEPARRRPLRPAWETALEELDRIAARDHVGHGALPLQYVEVTDVLRRYLEDRYGVPAPECTTTELKEHLRRAPLRGEIAARVTALLLEADLVKFARAHPDPAEARRTEARAREIVVETTPRQAEAA